PGPYERACLIAHYLKTKKPKSILIILDAKFSFSKQPVFEEAFARYYKDIIEVHLSNDIDDYSVSRVDTRTGEVYTPAGLTIKAAVANIIPSQRAGAIAHQAGLTNGAWCPIHPNGFRSTQVDDVYVLGDSSIAKPMPKSAFSAHSQAKIVVADILDRLDVKDAPPVKLRNTCWSMLGPDDSAKIGADYDVGERDGTEQLLAKGAFVSKPGEDTDLRRSNYEDSLGWYETLTGDVYPSRRG
nr:NAD(P)/FAD-dependent oxidoreductase [Alphaproteobacteria bacterium]